MQLVSHSSSYWPVNENVKRSQQMTASSQEVAGNGAYQADESEFNVKDYMAGLPQFDDVTYLEDDDALDYDINGFFNSVNNDNINDFYFYINQLLSKKPNQKSI
jgi:hypothetical protein